MSYEGSLIIPVKSISIVYQVNKEGPLMLVSDFIAFRLLWLILIMLTADAREI